MAKQSLKGKYESYILENAGKRSRLEMQVDLNITRNTLSKYAKELGVSLELDSEKRDWKEIDALILKYHKEKHVGEMRLLTGLTRFQLTYRARKLGVSYKKRGSPRPKAKSNPGFFNVMERDWLL